MMACFCSSQAAGSIPAILLNIPGTPSNATTCLEGFKLTRKGMAGQALGASIVSSTVGGLLSACFALVLTPVIGVYALSFGPAEMFMMALFGMTAVGSLTGKSTLKGLFSSAFGLFVACVGTEFNHGYTCSPFGFFELYEGFPLIPVLLGVFGFAELFSLVIANLLLFPIGLGVVRLAAKVTAVPNRFLVPIIALFCMAGGFAWRSMLFDMVLVVIFGVFGALLTRYGYSVPAFLLSLLLGPLAERNFYWAKEIGGMHSFMRTIALVILLATVGVLVLPALIKKLERRGKSPSPASG